VLYCGCLPVLCITPSSVIDNLTDMVHTVQPGLDFKLVVDLVRTPLTGVSAPTVEPQTRLPSSAEACVDR